MSLQKQGCVGFEVQVEQNVLLFELRLVESGDSNME